MIKTMTVLLALALSPSLWARDIDKNSDKLVAGLLDAAALKGKKVAVGAFVDAEGRGTALSDALSESIELELVRRAKKAGYQVLDRKHTADLVREWKLGMFGLVDAASAAQAGKLLGVDVLCLGKYADDGKRFGLSASLVNAQTGEILSAASGELEGSDANRELSRKYLKSDEAAAGGDSLKVEVWTDKDTLKLGDKMRVYAKANKDCFLTLIDVGTSGTATVIFPNNYSAGNQAKAGVTYTIPDPTAGFEFEAGAPTGVEIIRAIASKEPAVDLKEAMEAFSPDKPFGAVKDPPVLTRDIHVRAKKAKKGDWSEAVLKVTIR